MPAVEMVAQWRLHEYGRLAETLSVDLTVEHVEASATT